MPHIQADRAKVCVKEKVVVRLSFSLRQWGGKGEVSGSPAAVAVIFPGDGHTN